MIGENPSNAQKIALAGLGVPSVANSLSALISSYGAENVLAMSSVLKKIHDYNVGVIGASTSVYSSRMEGLIGAIRNYQAALLSYRDASRSGSPLMVAKKLTVESSHKQLQGVYANEMKVLTSGVKARKGHPLTDSKRATNIMRDSRNISKFNLVSDAEARDLVRFSRHAKFLGDGLAVIDFTSRVGAIRNEYKAGGEWEREMFIESSSFAVSAGLGIATANAGVAALGLLMIATPVGWVGLLVGGAVIAGTAAGVSMGANWYAKENSGAVYDKIMSLLR